MREYALRPKQSLCPVCSNRNGHVLYSVNSDQAAQHYVLNEVESERHKLLREHIESLWRQSTCDVVRCAECQFCFADPFVSGDARFYELAYQRSGYPRWKWEFERTFEALATLQARGGLRNFRLLEVGAGNGAFIRRIAPELTAKANVLCTEYSDFGRTAITEYGVKCTAQDVRELRAENVGTFDVICMFQVLEHLDQLDRLFEHLSSLAKGAAHLFIGVPNDQRIEFNELHGSLLDMPPNHVGRWNRAAFEIISRRHNWKLAEHGVQQEDFMPKARQFAIYRYGRRSQSRDSLANRIERVLQKRVRRPLQAAAVVGYSLLGLPHFYALWRNVKIGEAQWVHLQRDTS
jgi:2-polyprenyl-3-methyl-5-hydroxy-6-metoxy-1,4-benzoquinol methylase